MHLPEFDHSSMAWDDWRAFHIIHGAHNKFVQFDTGEFIVCARSWQPGERHTYNEFHLKVVATDDEDCPKLYLPGMSKVEGAKPIYKSHLNHHGQQVLLLDYDSKRAVGLWPVLKGSASIPERFTDSSRVAVYYAGPHAFPVGAPVTRQYPQPLTPAQRMHINELKSACDVWMQMNTGTITIPRDHAARSVIEFVDKSFSELTSIQRLVIARWGFDMLVKEKHEWLEFNPEEKGVTDDNDIPATS